MTLPEPPGFPIYYTLDEVLRDLGMNRAVPAPTYPNDPNDPLPEPSPTHQPQPESDPMPIHKICHFDTGDLIHTLDPDQPGSFDLSFNTHNLQGANFSGLDLVGVNFRGSDLTGSDFTGANLRNANFGSATLDDVSFVRADLTGAYLYGASIYGTDFTDADLSTADLAHTAMDGSTTFTDANFRNTYFYDCSGVGEAVWPQVTWSLPWPDRVYGISYCLSCCTVLDSSEVVETADDGARCDECGHSYCDRCDEHYADLDSHEEEYHRDDDEDEDDEYCNCGCQGNGTIRSYSYKPRWMHHGLSQVKFGFELELSGSRHHAGLVRVADPTEEVLICKDDSSIPGGGFEIVSHPMDLDWFNGNFDHSLIPSLRNAGMRTSDGAGLHVHVSRKSFSGNFHTLSWLNLIYRNSEAMTRFARRNSTQWAQFHKPAKGELPAKATAKGDQYRWDRYQFVNCQNSGTFEIRGFRSTLNRVKLRAALEFVDASVAYTRQVKTRDVLKGGGLTWTHFYNWVILNPNRYPHLQQQMEELTADYIETL